MVFCSERNRVDELSVLLCDDKCCLVLKIQFCDFRFLKFVKMVYKAEILNFRYEFHYE